MVGRKTKLLKHQRRIDAAALCDDDGVHLQRT